MRIGLRRGRPPREVRSPARGENTLLGMAVEGRIISRECRFGRISELRDGWVRAIKSPQSEQKQKQQVRSILHVVWRPWA